jgi:hypothetical protein
MAQKGDQYGDPISADAIAVAIVAAVAETKERAEDVARGVPAMKARALAVMALNQVYGGVAHSRLARCCGIRSHETASKYLIEFRTRIKNGKCGWWNEAALIRVIKRVEQHKHSGNLPRWPFAPLRPDKEPSPSPKTKAKRGDTSEGQT